MKSVPLAMVSFVAGALIVGFVLKHLGAGGKPSEEEESKPFVMRTNGQSVLKLDKPTQERSGLKSAPVEALTLKPRVKGYGRVLDPAPLAASLAEIAIAQAALEVSTKEFERLKVLHAQDQNVSTRALETAESAAKRDRIAADAAGLKLVAGWGRSIAGRSDLPEFVHSLVAQESALVRIDLAAGETPGPRAAKALLVPLRDEATPVDSDYLGEVASVDTQTQGRGFLFVVRGNSPALIPGAAVTGYLETEGEVSNGVVVPRAAVVRYEGRAWVYVQTDDETFVRREISADQPVEQGWFARANLTVKDRVVVDGPQMLLSAELIGAGPSGGAAE